jgi:hypothetical protein
MFSFFLLLPHWLGAPADIWLGAVGNKIGMVECPCSTILCLKYKTKFKIMLTIILFTLTLGII